MDSRARPLALAALLLFQLLSLSTSAAGAGNETVSVQPVSAGVALKSVTLFKKNSWLQPSLYFRCANGNITELSFVKQLLHFYGASGEEDWQPLFRLEPHSCEHCGVFERGMFHDARVAQWYLCTSNFSALDSDEPLKVVEKGVITMSLACPQCPVEDAVKVEPVDVEPDSKPSRWFAVLLAVFGVAGFLMVGMTIITIVIYFRRESSAIVYEEQSKMLEMDRSDNGSAASHSSSMPERASSEQLEQVPLEKRHTGLVFRDDRDDYV